MDLDTRLADMPIMAQRSDSIDARYFNVWQRAQKRFGNCIRLEGLGLKQLEMVMTDQYWVCVDAIQYDCPVLAWVDFKIEDRDNLHKPIPCKLNYYHFAASAVRARILDAMETALTNYIRAAKAP